MTDDMYIKVIPELFTADRDSWRSTCEAMVSQMVSQIERHVDYVAGCEIVTEEDNDGWISVKDRLPKDKTRCFITIQHDDLKTVEDGLFVDNTWFWTNAPLQHWTVIAWKPWPKPWSKPYKGD